MPLSSPYIAFAFSRRWFFVWDDIGMHLGWVWRGKAWEAAHTTDGWVFD
jgi:hypothetical protein